MSLGSGSGRPGITQKLGDYSVAGVATRLISYSGPPLDSDWGQEGAPPGTLVSDGTFLWLKTGTSQSPSSWTAFAPV